MPHQMTGLAPIRKLDRPTDQAIGRQDSFTERQGAVGFASTLTYDGSIQIMLEFGNPIIVALWLFGVVAYARGGMRFRVWAVEKRAGTPRFPQTLETVMLWLAYSLSISFVIALTLQVLRKL